MYYVIAGDRMEEITEFSQERAIEHARKLFKELNRRGGSETLTLIEGSILKRFMKKEVDVEWPPEPKQT